MAVPRVKKRRTRAVLVRMRRVRGLGVGVGGMESVVVVVVVDDAEDAERCVVCTTEMLSEGAKVLLYVCRGRVRVWMDRWGGTRKKGKATRALA